MLTILCCLAPQSADAANLIAVDDHFEILDSGTPDLSRSSLEANDKTHSGAWMVVVERPSHGSLTSDGAGGWIYQPSDTAAVVADSFRYRWADENQLSTVATVSWRVAPTLEPLGGRWPTRTCNDDHCEANGCGDGEGAELGWYDRSTGVFWLCDWVDDNMIDTCGRYKVPTGLLSQLQAGGRPLVIDWDGDDWDEPALLDPATGDVWIFEDAGEPCHDSCVGHCLNRVAVIEGLESSGFSSARSTPVAGQWELRSEGLREDVAWIDHATARAWFPSVGERGHLTAIDSGTTVVVAGDWTGDDIETLALWNADAGTLDIFADASGQGIQRVDIDGSREFHQEAAAFTASPSRCAEDWLGFFSPDERRMTLHPTQTTGPFLRAIMVDVPADPDGWPQSCPDIDPDGAR